MVYIRLVVFVLGLFFVMNALRNSYAHAYSDWEMNEKELVVTGRSVVPDQMGFDGANPRKMKLEGRKMIVHEVVMRKETEKVKGLHEGASKDISGKKDDAEEKPPGESQDNHQNDMDNLKTQTKKPAGFGIPRSTPNQFPNANSERSAQQDSRPLPTKASLESPSEGERQRALEATREIANLMHKDYNGMDGPRRRPPINNRVPVH